MSPHTRKTKLVCNYSTENREKEDKPKEEETKEPAMEEKPKMRSSHQKEEATSSTSGVIALLDVYLNKMLVSHHDKPGQHARHMFDDKLPKQSHNSVQSCLKTNVSYVSPEGGSIALIVFFLYI